MSNRYTLEWEEGAFYVVDHDNAGERRRACQEVSALLSEAALWPLGSDVLANGASVLLHYTPSMYRGQCVFDIKIVDADNNQSVVSAVNLCTITDVTFSRENGRVVYHAE